VSFIPHGHSSVQFGVSDTFYRPYKSCGSIEEPNDRRRSFSGYEDSRLFIGKNPTSGKTELYALCVHPASNTLRLSLLNVDTDGTVQNTRISPNYSIDVSVEGIPKRREKNWVPLPTLSKNGFPLLVYNLNPMQVIEMNTTSGIAVTVDKQPEWKCVKDELRGNTNYLRHPTNPHLLFGFCHVVETPKGGQWYGSQYFTRVVLLEQPDEKHWRLMGLSDPFRLPDHDCKKCAGRISYPMSLHYLGPSKEIVVFSMGYMDCGGFSVTAKTEDLLSSVKLIECK